MTLRLLLVLALLPALACGSRADEATPRPTHAPERARPAPAASAPAAPAGPRPVDEAEVHALLDAWLGAQNRGDFAAYEALYAHRFRGVRRTRDRVVALDRAGWMKDRRRMFERPMVVSIDRVEIAATASTAVVDVVQTWSSASFADTGPKRFLLVKEDGSLRIAQEEMLASQAAGATAALAARGLFPLIDGTAGPVAILGRADGAMAEKAPALITSADAVPVAVARDATEVPETLRALEGSRVNVVGASSACTGTLGRVRLVRAFVPHFGTVNLWLGRGDFEEQPAMPPREVAREAWELGTLTYYAADVTSECRGVLATPDRGTRPVVLPPGRPEAAERDALIAALASSPEGARLDRAWADLRRELGSEYELDAIPRSTRDAPADRVDLQAFGAPPRLLVAKIAPDGCGAIDPVEGLAFFEARPDGPRFTSRGSVPERARVVAVFDLEGDGVLEAYLEDVVGARRYVVRLGAAPGVLVEAEIPYFDCPC